MQLAGGGVDLQAFKGGVGVGGEDVHLAGGLHAAAIGRGGGDDGFTFFLNCDEAFGVNLGNARVAAGPEYGLVGGVVGYDGDGELQGLGLVDVDAD